MKDESAGKIITQIGIECNELREFADISKYSVNYVLEADFKDKKVRLSFEGVSYTRINGLDGTPFAVGAQLLERQKDGIKTCATKLKDNLLLSLKASTGSNW